MESTKVFLTLGFAFLACGVTFLFVGLSAHLLPLSTMAPAFIALGVVFMAVSRARSKRPPDAPAG